MQSTQTCELQGRGMLRCTALRQSAVPAAVCGAWRLAFHLAVLPCWMASSCHPGCPPALAPRHRSCDAAQQAAKVSPLQVGWLAGIEATVAQYWAAQLQRLGSGALRTWFEFACSHWHGNPFIAWASSPLRPPCPHPLPTSHLSPHPCPQSWRNLFQRQNLPMTIMSCSLAALQQLTGINAIIFYGEWACL